MPYEDARRGRVNCLDATGRFTLLADKCIIKSNWLVRRLMAILGLPKDTTVLRDLHYKCAVCMGKVPTRKQKEKGLGLLNLAQQPHCLSPPDVRRCESLRRRRRLKIIRYYSGTSRSFTPLVITNL